MNPEAWFLAAFRAGDVAAAQDILAVEPAVAAHTDYQAHPLLRACVVDNDGHCYKPAHLAIAELLVPEAVRTFRDAVVADQLDDVRDRLRSDRALVSAESRPDGASRKPSTIGGPSRWPSCCSTSAPISMHRPACTRTARRRSR